MTWRDAWWRARYAARVAGAFLGGLFLPWLLGLPRTDPLRGTVVVAPAVLMALWQLELWAAERGGRGRRRKSRVLDGGFLAAWLLLVAVQGSWELPFGAPVLAAILFLGVGWRISRLLLRLRPALGSRLPAWPPTPFFWLPLAAYVAILPWAADQRPPDGDEPYYLLVAHSLAWDGDADLGNNYLAQHSRLFMDRALEPQPGDPVGPQGQRYSRHNLLLPLFLALPYRLAGKTGALLAMAALTALTAWWFLRACGRTVPERPGEALLAWGLLAFAPPLLLYSHQVWVEVPAALLLLVGWDLASRIPEPGSRRLRMALLLGVAALLVFLKLRFLILALPLVLLGVLRSRKRLGAVLAGLGLLVLTGIVLLFNHLRFGNPLKAYSGADLAIHERSPWAYLHGGAGLFFDGAFGLFPLAPLWLVLVPALILVARRRSGLALRLAVVLGPYLVLVASRSEWFGGWSPPFRYGLVALPALALCLPPLLPGRRRAGARALLAALGALTAGLTLLWLAVPGWTYNLADGGNHLGDALSRILDADVNRLLPSMVRSRPATWIVPAAAVLATSLLWWRPRRRAAAAPAAGLTGLLLLLAGVPLLAARLPTRMVELEDPPAASRGGHLHPGPWTVERIRYPSGILLPEGASVRVPVVSGGELVAVELWLQRIENDSHPTWLTIGDGDRTLARFRVRGSGEWRRASVGPVAWRAGSALELAVERPPPGRSQNGVVIDRLELEWR